MKKRKHFQIAIYFLFVAVLALAIVGLKGCKEEEIELRTVNNPLIATYIAEYPEKYGEFKALLDTTGYVSFLKSYGTYTCFVPDNDAFKKFEERKKKEWRTLSMEELRNIVKYVVIKDTLSSNTFGDGKLSQPNMYNHYLSGGSVNADGVLVLRLNKQAYLKEHDIRVENGIIHVIDDVLEPPTSSIFKIIAEQDEYPIFTQALEVTGWDDTLNKISEDTSKMVWYTVLCESDEVFHQAGIMDIDALKLRFSNTGDPTLPTDSLNLFVRYHILKGLYYAADMPILSSYDTYVLNEVITVSALADSVFLNRQNIDNVFEKGAAIIRENSDYFSANGVLNAIDDIITIKSRQPYPIYWDLCEQPEITKLSGFRTTAPGGFDYPFPLPTSADNIVTWEKMSWAGSTSASIGYRVADSVMTGTWPLESKRFVYNDVMYMHLRAPGNARSVYWVEFTTPFVPRGEYKIWICHGMKSDNRELRTVDCEVYIDEVKMERILKNWIVLDTAANEEDLEFLGNKRYIYDDMPCPVYNNVLPKDIRDNFVNGSVYVGQMVGKVNFEKHGSHKIKLVALVNTNAGDYRLDMIHIIPADMDQIWPKFNYKGEKIYKPNR